MRVFVAGSTGAVGRFLVPHLVENGHEVVALVRGAQKARALEAVGAKIAFADALNKEKLTAAIRRTEPEVIIHELTALAGVGNLKKFDDEDPLDPNPPHSFSNTLAAIRYLEETIKRTVDLKAFALRYGVLYGPGTGIAKDGSVVDLVRKRKMPIVGDGTRIWSFIHIQDVARATVAAISRGRPGIYNIVDDEPAPVSTWLPFLADVLGAKPPRKVPVWLGKLAIGDGGVSMMTKIRGCSNAKAKREFGWQPVYPTWRRGFVEGLG